MSIAEILTDLPKLIFQDRTEIWEHLRQIEASTGPNKSGKLILDEAQADYDANPTAGSSWTEVETRLRSGQ